MITLKIKLYSIIYKINVSMHFFKFRFKGAFYDVSDNVCHSLSLYTTTCQLRNKDGCHSLLLLRQGGRTGILSGLFCFRSTKPHGILKNLFKLSNSVKYRFNHKHCKFSDDIKLLRLGGLDSILIVNFVQDHY